MPMRIRQFDPWFATLPRRGRPTRQCFRYEIKVGTGFALPPSVPSVQNHRSSSRSPGELTARDSALQFKLNDAEQCMVGEKPLN
jgi:hypothetical protein